MLDVENLIKLLKLYANDINQEYLHERYDYEKVYNI